jgi:hypothetical protein
MPLVHISLRKGKSRDYIRSIADGVHRALHEAFRCRLTIAFSSFISSSRKT